MAELKTPGGDHAILATGEGQYRALKAEMNRRVADFASGGTGRDVLSVISFLQSVVGPLQAVVDTPGVAKLAKDKYDDQTYDVVTSMGVLLTKLSLTIDEITTLIPTSGKYMLLMSLDVDNKPEWRAFTPAQLTPVTTKLNEIIAMIE